MSTKFFQTTVLIGLTVLVPTLAVATQSTRRQSIQQKVMLACRTETMKNDAGAEWVKIFVTNNTTKTILQGKTINYLVNNETRGSFSLNFALTPGATGTFQTPLKGKLADGPKAWIIVVDGG